MSSTANSTKRTVLLVEDSPTNQLLGVVLLEEAGYRVLTAVDGQDALEQVSGSQGAEIDFILMDLEMPNMDGLEATRRIRDQEQGTDRQIPILAMTAHAGQPGRQVCLDAGMDACLEKPLCIEAIESALTTLFDRLNPPHEKARLKAPPVGGEQPTSEDPQTSDASSVDWALAMKTVRGDQALLAEVIDAVLIEWPTRKAEGLLAIQNQDRRLLHRTAHSIAGLLRTFQSPASLNTTFQTARKLENESQSGDLAELEQLFSTLCEEFVAFIAKLQTQRESNLH